MDEHSKPTMHDSARPPVRQIRASFNETTIRVYQAYSATIAVPAVDKGEFGIGFKRTRMTWIKPSFLWMMYRCGWSDKDARQSHVLAIDITRTGFEWALCNSCLAHDTASFLKPPPVRV